MSETALDPAELTAALIRCPSVTPKDEGALDLVAAALEKLGFDCHRLVFGDINNLYARRGDGRPNLCFAGHTDVVPTGTAEAWSFDPFSATLNDGALCGRGAVDMKGAIAAFIAAAGRYLDKRGRHFGGSISLLITGDEEGDAVNGTRKVLDWLEGRGETIDACLVGEPTSAQSLGDMIKIGRRGSMTGRLAVHGVQGHTAYPHLADNAAHRLVAMLHLLTAAEIDRGSEHFQPSTLQVSTIDVGNPATNVIPATARAVFNIRFNDRWTSEKLERWLRQRLDEVGGRYVLDISVSGEAFVVAPGVISDCLAEAIRRITGRTPELSTTGGTSDARFIRAHCPVAEFGLVGLTMHKVDERVELSDLAALTEIYRTFLDLFFERSITREPVAVMAGRDPAIRAPDTPLLGAGAAVDHRVEPGDDDCE
jgi:succinyl-diaminopimelate desuccinylase